MNNKDINALVDQVLRDIDEDEQCKLEGYISHVSASVKSHVENALIAVNIGSNDDNTQKTIKEWREQHKYDVAMRISEAARIILQKMLFEKQ